MRGRPPHELLRQSAPLIAVAAMLVAVPVAAGAGGPSPDRAPAAPAGLAPDPVPGTGVPGTGRAQHLPVTTTPARPVTTAQASPRPVYVAPAVTHAAPKPVKHAAVVRRPAHRRAPPPGPKPPARFVLPRIAAPALVAASVPASHDLDAALAGVALLLAAVTAASGARLVVVWSRAGRAG